MKIDIFHDEKDEKPYPRLKITKYADNKYIVLFSNPYTGTVITLNGAHELGHWSEDWAESEFEEFIGHIKLSNN